jgi:hypothetical protein
LPDDRSPQEGGGRRRVLPWWGLGLRPNRAGSELSERLWRICSAHRRGPQGPWNPWFLLIAMCNQTYEWAAATRAETTPTSSPTNWRHKRLTAVR